MKSCFKANDIRGKVPAELNAELAYRIGRVFVDQFDARSVVVGYDVRLSSPELAAAVARGICDGGADVLDIGMCGTEEVYFSTVHSSADGGVMITASHNPAEYNGIKIVKRNAEPVSGDTGLFDIRDRALSDEVLEVRSKGRVQEYDCRQEYVEHLLGYVSPEALEPLNIVANSGNGCASLVLDRLEDRLPFTFHKVHHEPDGTFPHGIPNPLLPDRRRDTSMAVVDAGADMGIAWDGDFDRCFFYDENGEFIEGYYVVGLLARMMLEKHPGEKIIHDPRLEWGTREIVKSMGGVPVRTKTGHAFIKERMRRENAIYGGEMSAHHYFRDFFYCDSGMISWLLIAELLCRSKMPLSSLVKDMKSRYPVSGEINSRLASPVEAIASVRQRYEPDAVSVSTIDGISMDMGEWRFNLRCSNTEPVVRLNVESKCDKTLMDKKTDELLQHLESFN